MSGLPPYSTYRTDAKQMLYPQATTQGNVLSFTPPGFKQELHVKFPDSRLPVCQKCKKNFKTKDMCRVRNEHTSAPWTTAFICITVDDSCLDEEGRFLDEPMTLRMVQWQPYCVKTPFQQKTPVCAACKRTNRTRSFCRDRHQHLYLPWCTVYVLLSTLESVDPSTVVAGPPVKKCGRGRGTSSPDTGSETSKPKADDSTAGSESQSIGTGASGDDIHDIDESRTFLAMVSDLGTTVHWLNLAEYDPNQAPAFSVPEVAAPVVPAHFPYHPTMLPMDPSMQGAYYAPTNLALAQQQQNALKSRQQYFFQMHQQQYPVAVAGTQWHTAMHPALVAQPTGQEDSPVGSTAGEAAAAARQQAGDEFQLQLQQQQQQQQQQMQFQAQHWPAVYYPGYIQAPAANDDVYQEPDSKRSRIS